ETDVQCEVARHRDGRRWAEVVAAVPEGGVGARRTDVQLVGARRQDRERVVEGDCLSATRVGAASGARPALIGINQGAGHDGGTGLPYRPTEDWFEADVQYGVAPHLNGGRRAEVVAAIPEGGVGARRIDVQLVGARR